MNVASLELCKELHRLSGWDGTEKSWTYYPNQKKWLLTQPRFFSKLEHIPGYSLAYLLYKIPKSIGTSAWEICPLLQGYGIGFQNIAASTADTLEDAACKLAIELFKQGILK